MQASEKTCTEAVMHSLKKPRMIGARGDQCNPTNSEIITSHNSLTHLGSGQRRRFPISRPRSNQRGQERKTPNVATF